MLGNKNAVANVAVKDLPKARKFYEEILGLSPLHIEGEEVVVFKTGDTRLNVYRSDYAGTNKATAVTFPVGDEIDAIARALKAKGVTFDHYDFPGLSHEGDVHVMEDMRVAWFRDPEGNILNLVNR
jgi:catechol 2,3-dioxygenase-like lactoylglutathione lyase family enzyme